MEPQEQAQLLLKIAQRLGRQMSPHCWMVDIGLHRGFGPSEIDGWQSGPLPEVIRVTTTESDDGIEITLSGPFVGRGQAIMLADASQWDRVEGIEAMLFNQAASRLIMEGDWNPELPDETRERPDFPWYH